MILDLVTYSDADLVSSYIHKTAAGTPVNMTGYSLRLMVRRQANDQTAEFECSTHNGRIWWNNAAGGAFTLQIPISILSILAPGTYYQSLIATEPFSLLRREMWRGKLEHSAGPTRWELGTQ
jgi:hypothetical protein